MTGTTNYGWTLMAESQSQKFQTFNDDLQAIDTEIHSLATGGISLVAATDTVLGGIKVGEGLSMAVTSELLSVVYGTSSNTSAQGNDSRITGALQTTGGTMSAALHLSAPGGSDNTDKAVSSAWVRTYVTGLGFGTGSGTVTSVDLTMPTLFSVTGNPVTGSGTLAVTLATQSANLVLAGPTTGSPAAPTMRALVAVDLPAGTPNTGSNQTWTAAQRSTISALTDGTTITPDFAVANNFSVTLGGNRTLANPSNITAGQAGQIVVKQDGTGTRTLAFGSQYKFAGGTAPTLSTAANAVDVLSYFVWDTTHIAVSSGLAFA